MDSPFFKDNFGFNAFTPEHYWAVFVCFVYGIAYIWYARTQKHYIKSNLFNILGFFVSGYVIFWTFVKLLQNNFNPLEDYPFIICNVMALFLPVFTITKSKLIYEITLFWSIFFTFQAMITPDFYHSFPHYSYFKFWIVHGGVVLALMYATFVFHYRPTFKSIFKSVGGLLVYMGIVAMLNKIIGANYFYLNGKPETASVMDYFGDWPNYIFWGLLLIIPIFIIIYIPFYLELLYKKKYNKLVESK